VATGVRECTFQLKTTPSLNPPLYSSTSGWLCALDNARVHFQIGHGKDTGVQATVVGRARPVVGYPTHPLRRPQRSANGAHGRANRGSGSGVGLWREVVVQDAVDVHVHPPGRAEGGVHSVRVRDVPLRCASPFVAFGRTGAGLRVPRRLQQAIAVVFRNVKLHALTNAE